MSSAPPIVVPHSRGSYPVVIETGILARLESLAAEVLPGRRLVVVTDRNVARAVTQPLKAPVLVVPAGESSKSRRRWNDLTDQLLELGLGRDGAVVALGGGVVGDLTGFVAATYLRGIPHLQVPTSLLAMVDAAVGGKTGLNTRHGKNLVGAFHPPVAVVIDPLVVATLRSTHVRGGLIEALKHGVIADRDYLEWISANAAALSARDPAAVERLVRTSVAIKAAIVTADEREEGKRAVLNAGHTVGHGLELLSSYRLPHGDAVGLGLIVEAAIAEQLGLAPAGLAADLAARLRGVGLTATLPEAGADDRLLEAIRRDKKVVGGVVRMALPRAPGALAGADPATTAVAELDVRQALGRARRVLGPRLFHTAPAPE